MTNAIDHASPQPPKASRKHARPFEPYALIFRPRHLRAVTGLSPCTIWRLRRDGLFPPALKLSKGSIGWSRSAIEQWLGERAQVGR